MNAARTGARTALAMVAGALLLLVAAPAASAQSTNPYGSTTTTVPGGSSDTSCVLSVKQGRAGDTVQGTVSPLQPGAVVRILFDGVQIATGTAPAANTGGGSNNLARTDRLAVPTRSAASVFALSAATPVVFDSAVQAAPQSSSVTITFTVPDVTIGAHSITAVGANFTCFCNPDGVFTVLAKRTGTSVGSLARTGIYVGLLLVIAAALFVLGRAFLRASKIARARAEASARDAHRTTTHAGR